MDQNPVKIADLLTTEYADFLSYCLSSGKVFTSELTNVDYVAFRACSGQSREYIKTIRNIIEKPTIVTPILTGNDDLSTSQEKAEMETELNVIVPLAVEAESNSVILFGEDNVNRSIEDTLPDIEIVADFESGAASEKSTLASPLITQTFEASPTKKMSSDEPLFIQKKTLKADISSDAQYSLAYLFGVEASDFSDISVEQLYLSVRASNCLRNANYITLEDVLNKTVAELQGIRNMGVKSVNEIVQNVKDFVSNPANIDSIVKNKLDLLSSLHRTASKPIDDELKVAVEALLVGEEYTVEGMTDVQIERLNKFKEATSVVGEEICLAAYLNPQYNLQICNMLLEFAAPCIQYKEMIEEAIHRISLLSDSMRERKVIPFIKAYEVKEGKKLSYLLSECKEDTTISKIPYLYEAFCKEENFITLAIKTNNFLSWLSFDIEKLIATISDNIRKILSRKNKRSMEVFSLRAEGKTLEEIGGLYGITRERVRQIELKVYRTFWSVYSKQKYDLIMLVYALRNGDTVLYLNEIKELLGSFAGVSRILCKVSTRCKIERNIFKAAAA